MRPPSRRQACSSSPCTWAASAPSGPDGGDTGDEMMARTGQRGRQHREELIVLLSNGPEKLSSRAYLRASWRTVVEFIEDDLPDRAASLTYYAMLSIFPGLLVLLAVVSLIGGPTGRNVVNGMRSLAIGPTAQVVNDSINSLQQDQRAAGI